MVIALSRSSKPFSTKAETFLGTPNYSPHCQHIGIGWLLIPTQTNDRCCEMCNIHWPATGRLSGPWFAVNFHARVVEKRGKGETQGVQPLPQRKRGLISPCFLIPTARRNRTLLRP